MPMALSLTWERNQNRDALLDMRARNRVDYTWRIIWAICVVIGAISMSAIFGIFIRSRGEAFIWEIVFGNDVLGLGILIGILGIMFVSRDFVESRRTMPPLSVIIEKRIDKKQEVSEYMSKDALRIIDNSFLRGESWYPWYLFMELLKDKRIIELLTRLGIDAEDMSENAKKVEFADNAKNNTPDVEKNQFMSIAFKALEIAYRNNDDRVHVGDLFVALISQPGVTRDFMVDYGIRESRLEGVNSWLHFQAILTGKRLDAKESMLVRTHSWRNQLWTSTVTPLLDSVGVDMTRNAWQYSQLVARDSELSLLYEEFGAGNFGVLIVGPKGAGKSSFIEGVAKKIIANQAPPPLADRRMVTLSVAKLLSLSSARTPFKVIAAQLAREIARSGNIIIVLEDFSALKAIKTDEAGELVESLLMDIMRGGHVLLLAAIHEEELASVSGQLISSLPRITIASLDDESTIRAIESSVPMLESKYNVAFTYPALERIASLSTRFMHDGAQPGKARALMESVARELSVRGKRTWVRDHDVERAVSNKVGIPVTQVSDREKDLLVNLEERIHEKYINQVTAVRAVATAMRRARTQLGSSSRPIANMLFLGPTGVGKTELAKRLAEVYFGGRDKMVRLDMSEYQEVQSIRNLIGAPIGSSGNELEGHLVSTIRENPFSVILLDEFEKAHPDVLNIFLQIMEDGRLTSPDGKTYDFTNSLIIATSNAGAERIQEEIKSGKKVQDIAYDLKQHELVQYFRPELINRFDAIVVFETLSFGHIVEISKLLLSELSYNLAKREIILEVSPDALKDLAREGYVPSQGARPLRRVIQDNVEDQIAKLLLKGEVQARDTIILKKGFKLEVKKAQHYN